MLNKIKEFFSKMKNDEHSLFEIIMFSISGVVSVVVLVCAIMLGNFMFSKQDTVTDQEADAGSVTGSAVTETEEPSATATPDANSVVHEDDNTNDDIDAFLANSDYAYTTTSVNMRSDASLTSSVLTKVPSGTKLKLTKLSDDKQWCEVEYNGQTGYIKSLYLSTTKPKPIETVAPTTQPTQSSASATRTPVPKATKTPKPKATKTPKPKSHEEAGGYEDAIR